MAGSLGHHRINMDKFHPGYFGKVGMRQFHMTKQQNHCPIVNLDGIRQLSTDVECKEGEAVVIDTLKAVSLNQTLQSANVRSTWTVPSQRMRNSFLVIRLLFFQAYLMTNFRDLERFLAVED